MPHTTGADHYAEAHYFWLFALAPFVGGILAGLFILWHASNVKALAKVAGGDAEHGEPVSILSSNDI